LLKGRVVTFRPTRRTVGNTHVRWKRTGTKKADVVVRELRVVDPSDAAALADAQPMSGFDSVAAWQAAIRELHGVLPEQGWLYEVVVVDTVDGVDGRRPDNPDVVTGDWSCGCGEEFVVTSETQLEQRLAECPDHSAPVDL
jgi:hypothetical protein